jgi:polysaccharide biosynthesis transport protein
MKELLQNHSSEAGWPAFLSPQKAVVFGLAFGISALLSLTYTFSRPGIYQSSAKLLYSPAVGIDQAAYPQHFIIQRQVLLSQDLLDETLKRLEISRPGMVMDVSQLRKMLVLEPVPEAHLMEIRAEGEDAKLLPLLINTWIDVYLDARVADSSKSKNELSEQIKATLADLDNKIEAARISLDNFERDNSIKSAVSEQNETKARIKGLISSYSNASEEELKAKAQLDAINKAIDDGEVILPPQDNPAIINLQQRLKNLKDKLNDFSQDNYRANIAIQPSLKMIPEEIKKLENEIDAQRLLSIKMVRSNAERRYFSARQIAITLRKQLAEQKELDEHYTQVLKQSDVLHRGIEDLEKIYREHQEQLMRIETQQLERYPLMNVVARALQSREPIRPNYMSDAWLALSGSFLFGLFCVWMSGLLNRQPSNKSELAIFNRKRPHKKASEHFPGVSQKYQTPKALLPEVEKVESTPVIRELSQNELRSLLANANNMSKQLISLLLCGLSLTEVAHLTPKDFNKHTKSINVNGDSARRIELPSGLSAFFEQSGLFPVWYTGKAFSLNDLSAWLTLTAIDSGVGNPEEVSSLCLRHACILHLLRKGVRLSELERIVGFLNPAHLLSYADYVSPEAGLSIEQIDKFHPVLIEYFNSSNS